MWGWAGSWRGSPAALPPDSWGAPLCSAAGKVAGADMSAETELLWPGAALLLLLGAAAGLCVRCSRSGKGGVRTGWGKSVMGTMERKMVHPETLPGPDLTVVGRSSRMGLTGLG